MVPLEVLRRSRRPRAAGDGLGRRREVLVHALVLGAVSRDVILPWALTRRVLLSLSHQRMKLDG